jgi:pantoate--beta-alanine ligase
MVIFKKAQDLKAFLAGKRQKGQRIGFVPTMGALHAGHTSLVEAAVAQSDLVVCSIFINPTQFTERTDFEKYPVTTEADIEMLIDAGCNVLYMPAADDVYPDGPDKMASFSFGYLDAILEGAMRPGHFTGVGQVVGRLLDIVEPDLLFMGQKDFQQCMVVKKLLELKGLSQSVKMVICATKREADGLAMSSRNQRLNQPQRTLSASIYQCLVSIQGKLGNGSFELARKECIDLLKDKGFDPEYVELADAKDLAILRDYDSSRSMVTLIAAKIGGVRLIDNLLLQTEPEPVR